LADAEPGFDVVILKRGSGDQPGPNELNAPGHVGLFGGVEDVFRPSELNIMKRILLLGGNQSNGVNLRSYPLDRVLGIRRLYDVETSSGR